MGETDSGLNAEITTWLRAGGFVVAASERAARSLTADYHRVRREEGLSAWATPAILDWQSFLRTAWQDRSGNDGRLLLDPLQEQSLWANIAGSEQRMATLLEGPRNRMANLAMQAHQLLCSHAPKFLRQSARAAWQLDAENFSAWLAAFDETCRDGNLLSPARLPVELIQLLEAAHPQPRPPLLLAGFDRFLPAQRRLFDAWGKWREASSPEPTREVCFYHAADTQAELAACALWCKRELAANPQANLLVITQNLAERRGEIERAFLDFATAGTFDAPNFEFSLGIPAACEGPGLIRVELQVSRGPVGIGVLNTAETDFLRRVPVRESGKPQSFDFLVSDFRQIGRVVIQNWDTPGVHSASIRSLTAWGLR